MAESDKTLDHRSDQVSPNTGNGGVGNDELGENELDQVTGGTIPAPKPTTSKLFEIEDFSFDIEQTLNIGSQSTGPVSKK